MCVCVCVLPCSKGGRVCECVCGRACYLCSPVCVHAFSESPQWRATLDCSDDASILNQAHYPYPAGTARFSSLTEQRGCVQMYK